MKGELLGMGVSGGVRRIHDSMAGATRVRTAWPSILSRALIAPRPGNLEGRLSGGRGSGFGFVA